MPHIDRFQESSIKFEDLLNHCGARPEEMTDEQGQGETFSASPNQLHIVSYNTRYVK